MSQDMNTMRRYGPIEIAVEAPLKLTVEGNTNELVVQCYQAVSGSTEALEMNLRFSKEASAGLVHSIKHCLDAGIIEFGTSPNASKIQ